MKKNIVQGRSLFDVENVALIATLNSILKSAGLRVAQNEKELPVNLFMAGKNFTFNNSGNSFSTVIGIYKGNDRVKKITVDGVQIFAGSITELLTASGGTFETPVDHPYSIPGMENTLSNSGQENPAQVMAALSMMKHFMRV